MNPRTECLRKSATAFIENVFRTDSFALLPEWISFRARSDQIWRDYAILKTTGKLDSDLLQPDDEATRFKIDAEIARLKKQFRSLPEIEIERMRTKLGVEYVDRLLRTEAGMNQGMQGIMSSVIIESWIAFETLASDLWVAALDNGPSEFRQRFNASHKQEKPDEEITQPWKGKLEYDPSKNYGSSMREIGRATFQKLDRIIQHYSIVFENDVGKLFRDTRDGYIYALSAYRNVLIHNAGKVDKKFIKQVERLSDLRGTFKENQELQLDGELVSKLRDAAIDLGNNLILFIDNLITPLKTP